MINQEEYIKILCRCLEHKVIVVDSETAKPNILSAAKLLDSIRGRVEVKLCLYDTSYLTKPIKHNGREFIPAKVLFGVSAEEEDQFDVYGTIPEYWKISIKQVETNLDYVEYWIVQKMIEWHINVFNLKEGEYINKHTIK